MRTITNEELVKLSEEWADTIIEKGLTEEDIAEMKIMYSDNIKEFLHSTFINGFLGGAIQILKIIEKEQN